MNLTDIALYSIAGYGGYKALGQLGSCFFNKKRSKETIENKIGHIYLRGEIKGYSPTSTPLGKREEITPKNIKEAIDNAINDNVKGLILDIDSPGGAIVPSKEIADYIKEINIPVVGVVKGMAASGGYWIASACDHIIANEYSMIGSIGVILPRMDLRGLLEKVGVEYDGFKAGEYKDLGNPFREITKEERQILQEELNEAHEGFRNTISENREISIDDVKDISKGLIYSGKKALSLNLIDQLGNTKEGIKYIEQKTNIENLMIQDYDTKVKKGLFDFISSVFDVNSLSHNLGASFGQGLKKSINYENDLRLK